MEAWFIAEHARRRCDELRAQALRDRLARGGRARRPSARRRFARVLVALGSMFVAAGNRVDDAAAAAN